MRKSLLSIVYFGFVFFITNPLLAYDLKTKMRIAGSIAGIMCLEKQGDISSRAARAMRLEMIEKYGYSSEVISDRKINRAAKLLATELVKRETNCFNNRSIQRSMYDIPNSFFERQADMLR
jgi:hypothetical protein